MSYHDPCCSGQTAHSKLRNTYGSHGQRVSGLSSVRIALTKLPHALIGIEPIKTHLHKENICAIILNHESKRGENKAVLGSSANPELEMPKINQLWRLVFCIEPVDQLCLKK